MATTGTLFNPIPEGIPETGSSQVAYSDQRALLYHVHEEKKHLVKRVDVDIVDFLREELAVKTLNQIHWWLRIAGLPAPPRPLNYQRARGRSIVLSEETKLHMVWNPGRMFLKPLPPYFFQRDFWESHARDVEVHALALGLLRSYVTLIQYPSDLAIAKAEHLVPDTLEWADWARIVTRILDNPIVMEQKSKAVNIRYHYGELRLSRLNKIMLARMRLRAYYFPYQSYGEMFRGNLDIIATASVYIALALTAMQVGLATTELQTNHVFMRASYGFTVFSILGPLIVFGLILGVLVVYIAYNAIYMLLVQDATKHDSSKTDGPVKTNEPAKSNYFKMCPMLGRRQRHRETGGDPLEGA